MHTNMYILYNFTNDNLRGIQLVVRQKVLFLSLPFFLPIIIVLRLKENARTRRGELFILPRSTFLQIQSKFLMCKISLCIILCTVYLCIISV